MARPKNEDQPVTMLCDAAILWAGMLPSITAPIHRGDTFEITRKEADALILFRYATEVTEGV